MDNIFQNNLVNLKSGIKLDENLANTTRINHGNPMGFPVSLTNNSSAAIRSFTEESHDNFSEEADYSDAILKYISQMLMEEEDLEQKPCMFYDSMALQVTEIAFYDALKEPEYNSPAIAISSRSSMNSLDSKSCVDSNWGSSYGDLESSSHLPPHGKVGTSMMIKNGNLLVNDHLGTRSKSQKIGAETTRVENHLPNYSSWRKKHQRDEEDDTEYNSSKLLATSVSDNNSESVKMHKSVLFHSSPDIYSDDEVAICSSPKASLNEKMNKSRLRRPEGGENRRGTTLEAVDLRALLMQCAEALARFDSLMAEAVLRRIRQQSSPTGDAIERVAYYFANALEARLSGTGTAFYASAGLKKPSAAEILKAYHAYVTTCPFKRISNVYANKTIKNVTGKAATLHIIDFGVLYGYQWPCLIQTLSERPGGPPKLRITGIDCPQPGFRPAARVEETGLRLAKYCKRFNVPFEYNPIAQKWDTIKLEDLYIEKDGVLIVNCLDRLGNVPDETVVQSSPRDVVLRLIRQINPDIFVHGVINGTYNNPFFATRFKEAHFHFASLFDMLESTMPPEDQQRLLFEREVIGRDVMNVIACEGTERVERSETYKQWQGRHTRAGLRQLPLDMQIVQAIRDKVKKHYHKDFIVDVDGNWMLQGWK